LASSSTSGPDNTCGQPPLTVSTTVVSANAIVYDSQLDLGHADPAITLRVYAHVIRSAEAAAADIFAEAVNAAQSAPAAHPRC
jgi:hypothetical protein